MYMHTNQTYIQPAKSNPDFPHLPIRCTGLNSSSFIQHILLLCKGLVCRSFFRDYMLTHNYALNGWLLFFVVLFFCFLKWELSFHRWQIINSWFRSRFFKLPVTSPASEQLFQTESFFTVCNTILILVSEKDCSIRTFRDAGRQFTFGSMARTKITFGYRTYRWWFCWTTVSLQSTGCFWLYSTCYGRPKLNDLWIRTSCHANLHPIQRSLSTATIPSERLNVASTGHTLVHGGLSQW